jgi:hypothetical protein
MIAKHHIKTGNTAAIVLAIIASTLLFLWNDYSRHSEERAEQARREAVLPDQWFVVRNIAIPDFVQGADPLITYSREIRQPFIGEWIAEVHGVSASNDFPICVGSGRANYTPKETLPDAGVLLSWYMGKDCRLEPGKYVIDTTWRILPEGYPPKVIQFASNPFAVRPVGSQLYVSPSQVEKLE